MKKFKKSINALIIIFFSLIIFFLSIGFASLNSVVNINELYATVRLNHDIRITKIQIESSSSAISNYEEFNTHNIGIGVSLNTSDAYIKYRLTITNFGNIPAGILKVDNLPDNLLLEFENYTLKDKICSDDNICTQGSQKDIIIKIKYKDDMFNSNLTNFNLLLNFNFQPVFKLNFNSNNGDTSPHSKYVMYNDLYGTLYTPTKAGHTFEGWYLNGEKITENTTVLTENDHTLEALWKQNEFTVTFNPNGGSVSTGSKTVKYNETYGDLPTPTYSGKEFLGWFTSSTGGTQIVPSTTVQLNSNQTLYAHWKDKCSSTSVIAKLEISPRSGTPSFSSTATSNEGVYSMIDDYGTSYYYRGAVTNNYVKFAGFYWRIIRVNGDGTLRIIYDGTQAFSNGASNQNRVVSTIAWNTSYYNDAKYTGYMYGGTNGTASTTKTGAQTNSTSSNVKTQAESWYTTNILNKGYDQYVEDRIFCNDRNTDASFGSYGYGTGVTGYMGRYRLYSNKSPSFKCTSKNDAFTKSDTTKGNGKLNAKVGLITADEVSAAGGVWNTNNTSYYLYKGTWYWTMTPGHFWGDANIIAVTDVLEGSKRVSLSGGLAPVINLSNDYICNFIGNGSSSNPFRAPGVNP